MYVFQIFLLFFRKRRCDDEDDEKTKKQCENCPKQSEDNRKLSEKQFKRIPAAPPEKTEIANKPVSSNTRVGTERRGIIENQQKNKTK